ncbi:hypothetical protein ASPWEDRAFT_44043 [Aspergillus wentii DTO 134E9]|uniref:Uncharacterized protein n=1 Tax=Aspergillus wentii DTO 134E9 TaxID=1073089 RepID=A0A1L9RAS5_ASPWE|nr:uncharacterized protein ASPWEDRAFT_44043 [Aspergillus wentii DTO 134E9]KAI9934604.1 bifunctional AP-4-A phosphorylase/ADP sulfurylase [Aspergillus wentii]OJJ32025.1 hypothetical protein ASPWEDRAFT_44043 [Aspergillus wentii DTO 134E9]
MQLSLSETLPALVSRRFTTAKDAGHLTFSQTYLSIIHASGIPYQLRYCPALAKKPTGAPKPDKTVPAPKPDPFHDPSPDLLLAQIPAANPTHNLVLNKFPVIPNHFILATTAWKAQTDILEKGDLEAAYACVSAWRGDEKVGSSGSRRLYAFFNSGDESGASQPHRHLQFLPVEDMRDGEDGWEPLIDLVSPSAAGGGGECRRLSRLPFAQFARPLPANPSADVLHAIYLSLYKTAFVAVKGGEAGQDIPTEGPAAISYNLAMTESTMMICPRRSDSARIPVDAAAAANVSEAGVVALNGTILAGTLMVKAEAEWDELRRSPETLTSVLATIGYPQRDLRGVSSL